MPRGGIKIRAYNLLQSSLLVSFSEGLNNIFSQCIKSTYKHFARALPKMFVYCPCTNALNLGAVTINWRKFLGTNGKKQLPYLESILTKFPFSLIAYNCNTAIQLNYYNRNQNFFLSFFFFWDGVGLT